MNLSVSAFVTEGTKIKRHPIPGRAAYSFIQITGEGNLTLFVDNNCPELLQALIDALEALKPKEPSNAPD